MNSSASGAQTIFAQVSECAGPLAHPLSASLPSECASPAGKVSRHMGERRLRGRISGPGMRGTCGHTFVRGGVATCRASMQCTPAGHVAPRAGEWLG
jgi:hypothetical protein